MGRRGLKPGAGGAEGSTLAKDKIVEAIAYRMSAGDWAPFRSVRELALSQGITLENAQKYAAESARLLRLSWGGEEAKALVLERIAQVGRAAELRTEEVVDAKGNVVVVSKPDHRTALAALKHLADILGLSGSNSEVVIRYQQMSDSDLAREATLFLAKLIGGDQNGKSIEAEGAEIPEAARGAEGHERSSESEQGAADDQAALAKLVNLARPGR